VCYWIRNRVSCQFKVELKFALHISWIMNMQYEILLVLIFLLRIRLWFKKKKFRLKTFVTKVIWLCWVYCNSLFKRGLKTFLAAFCINIGLSIQYWGRKSPVTTISDTIHFVPLVKENVSNNIVTAKGNSRFLSPFRYLNLLSTYIFVRIENLLFTICTFWGAEFYYPPGLS
jgi:hypothetical protein